MLDTRFLQVHPRTRLWWAQRATCRTCAHYRQERSVAPGGTGTVEHCAAGRRGAYPAACIEMRDEGQRCGTEALLYMEAQHA